jgi:hypothetical protein
LLLLWECISETLFLNILRKYEEKQNILPCAPESVPGKASYSYVSFWFLEELPFIPKLQQFLRENSLSHNYAPASAPNFDQSDGFS